MRTETQVLSPVAPEPGQRGAMVGPQPLALLLVLLTLCLSTGTPEVWVQIKMEATKVPSFTIRCGFLGSGSISLVTVSWGGPDVAGGTRLAVLHPDFGTQQWAPAHQAHWEARTNISLTLGGSEGKSPSPNSTFCCKFVSFPEGSQEACGNLLLSTDQGRSDEERGPGREGKDSGTRDGREGLMDPSCPSGASLSVADLPAPTPASILRAHLAGIFGVSGVLLFGCIFLLHLLQQRHWSVPRLLPPHTSPWTQRRAQPAGQTSRASLHIPYTTVNTNYFCPAALEMAHHHQQLSRWPPLPIPTTSQTQALAPWAPLPASAHSSFISVENVLYAQAGGSPPHSGPGSPNLIPFPDPLEPKPRRNA
ncbi:transmembrane protein PVRIG isoform X1 [Trichechus manatus latirostris]|uniref:Transmembrane protein PVRIG isoform X1 n=1 Tax=Trichechus manatus latirostris TaxID=127582 RepID=A0A2Y9RP94_TRIMA|nr:transmembrane protein PVRIG isoform X1 [Trichechus manatus latirostris]